MKQKDWMLIIVIAFVSGVASLVLTRYLFAPAKDRHQQVEVVDAITSDFPTPDPKYFNTNALDPTQLIRIGDSTNPNPFNGSTSQ